MNRLRAVLAAHSDPGERDRGAATIFVVALSTMLLVLTGLVVDGGLAINARARAADDAEQAARTGARELDLDTLRATGEVRLNEAEAVRQAQAYINARGPGGVAAMSTVNGEPVVQVTVQRTEPTAMLSLIGIDSLRIRASANARVAVGIDAELP